MFALHIFACFWFNFEKVWFGQLPRLDLASKDMGVIEYYNLDIIFPFLIVCFTIIYGIIKVFCKVISNFLLKKEKFD